MQIQKNPNYRQVTPSVCFNFEDSHKKKDLGNLSHFSYDYSSSTLKQKNAQDNQNNQGYATPVIGVKSQVYHYFPNTINMNNKNEDFSQTHEEEIKSIKMQKVNSEVFFQEFDSRFVVNFSETPLKELTNSIVQSEVESSKINSDQIKTVGKSNPSSKNPYSNQKQKVLEKNRIPEKQNIFLNSLPEKNEIKTCQIRKRVLKSNNFKRKPAQSLQISNKSTFSKNMMLVTFDSCNTNLIQNKKCLKQILTQPIKSGQKTMKKMESHIFSSRQIFKQTLRSTTLDNWKKKFTIQRCQFESKSRPKGQIIFNRPF